MPIRKNHPDDYQTVTVKIHKELKWKLEREVDLINKRKKKSNSPKPPTTFDSILNDCLHVGVDELEDADQLESEYNKFVRIS